MMSEEEKVLKELKEDEDAESVEKGEEIIVSKNIGYNKNVTKNLKMKPSFTVREFNNGLNYVFIVESVFDVFKTLNKFLLFKTLGVPLDFGSDNPQSSEGVVHAHSV